MSRTKTWPQVLVGATVVIVLLLLWMAIYLSLRHKSATATSDPCGSPSPGEELTLLWLAQLRQDAGIPISEISLGRCESGVRGGVTAAVEIGRSTSVQEFFSERYDCDIKQACSIATDAAAFRVRLRLIAADGWSLTASGVPMPASPDVTSS